MGDDSKMAGARGLKLESDKTGCWIDRRRRQRAKGLRALLQSGGYDVWRGQRREVLASFHYQPDTLISDVDCRACNVLDFLKQLGSDLHEVAGIFITEGSESGAGPPPLSWKRL